MDADEDTIRQAMQGQLLRDADARVLLGLPMAVPLAPAERQRGYQLYGGDVSRWRPGAQLQWLATQGGGWQPYVHPATLRAFQDSVVPQQAQALREAADREEQRGRLRALNLVDSHWARGSYGPDLARWPEPLRRRMLLGVPRFEADDSSNGGNGDGGGNGPDATDIDAGGSGGGNQNAPPTLPLPLALGCCGACLLAGRAGSCDLDIDVGIGCSACRDANMDCVAWDGSPLANRPPQDVCILLFPALLPPGGESAK